METQGLVMNFRRMFNLSSYSLVLNFFNSSINVYLQRSSSGVTNGVQNQVQNESDAGAVSPGECRGVESNEKLGGPILSLPRGQLHLLKGVGVGAPYHVTYPQWGSRLKFGSKSNMDRARILFAPRLFK